MSKQKINTIEILNKWLSPLDSNADLEFGVTNVINVMTGSNEWDWDVDEKAIQDWATAKFPRAKKVEVSEGGSYVGDDDQELIDWVVTVSY